jgi:NAD(P)-dependent dehydrogenase (short-subunit alcohol dehydrogenase family)
MSKPIVLILGSGANVGRSVAHKFAADGYLVAISARSLENGISPESYITIKADYSHRDAIPTVFDTLKAIAGIPNVVIYNGKNNVMSDVRMHSD